MTDKTTETLSLCSRAGWTASQAYVAESSRLVGRNLMVLVTVFRPAEVPSSSASSRESKKKNLVKIRVEKNRPLENLTWNISVYDLSPKLKWCSEIIFVRDVEQKIDWIILHYVWNIFHNILLKWEISYYAHIGMHFTDISKVFFNETICIMVLKVPCLIKVQFSPCNHWTDFNEYWFWILIENGL